MWKRWIEIRFSNRLAIIKPFTQERWETHNGASSVWWTSFARLSSPPRNWCENRCHNWEKLLESLKLRMEVFNSARPSRNRNVTRSSNESRNAYRIAHKIFAIFSWLTLRACFELAKERRLMEANLVINEESRQIFARHLQRIIDIVNS